jgi:ABC-type bacteriocin/lantibiotic exporter with double-glycine peptidase domain
MLIIISMNELSAAIQGLSNFITTYQRILCDYNNFKEFWEKDIEFEKDFIKLLIRDNNIVINNIEIIRGDNYVIKKDKSIDKLYILPKMKFLIQGPSGHGKSSFLKGIFGLIKTSTVDFSHGTGIQYYHSVSDYFQEIKEKMPSSKVSIRDYFKGEINNDIIKNYLLQAWKQEEYNRIIDSIKESKTINNENEDDHLINIDEPIDPYDMLINEKLSGGQKSRLILWTRGYNVDTTKKEIIILDEPCPDVDFDSYIDNLKRFYKKYEHCTIFLIGHLCECKRKSLNINFDTELWIENGIISIK